MKIVIFGLTISSSWGNGHATLWRGLCRSLRRRGHDIVFFERDVPYYASHRDLTEIQGGILEFYTDWESVLPLVHQHLQDADVAMVTSYCPDGIAASDLVLDCATPLRVFYDLDTPVTLEQVRAGQQVSYLPPQGLNDFDLVLSYTGGQALEELKERLGARRVAPLYGSVDPQLHCPVSPVDWFQCDLSYLGTYAADRQQALERLFIAPAGRLPQKRFLIGGAQYPADFPWTKNIYFAWHVAPGDHPAFYCSSKWTLNVTRQSMAAMGYCPSGRLFEAAACGVPIISDWWEGLDQFFEPGKEIVVARGTEDTIGALQLDEAARTELAQAARARVLGEHTADHRAIEFETIIEEVAQHRQRERGVVAV
jgi:spore maturation protein CgeB